jgi:MFS family permease
MTQKKKILFFVLELVSGIGIGILGAYLTTPENPKHDLFGAILILYLKAMGFALIGIGMPGFFHSRINDKNKKYAIGIGMAVVGILVGMILGTILSSVISGILPYRISSGLSLYISFFTPILFGVIGFNKVIKRDTNNR